MRQLDRRISRLEWLLRPPPPRCQVIRIRGGLPDQDGCHASVGELRFQRQPDEDQAAFEARVIDAAREVGASLIVIGGLPPVGDDLIR